MSNLASDSINEFQKKVDSSKLKDDEQLRDFKKEFFTLVKIVIIVMFGIAYTFMLDVSRGQPNTGATVIVVTSMMIPTVITLALIRFLYAKKENDKSIPSVGYNFLKELLSIVKSYVDKKSQ